MYFNISSISLRTCRTMPNSRYLQFNFASISIQKLVLHKIFYKTHKSLIIWKAMKSWLIYQLKHVRIIRLKKIDKNFHFSIVSEKFCAQRIIEYFFRIGTIVHCKCIVKSFILFLFHTISFKTSYSAEKWMFISFPCAIA